jgi:hypothetical protein
LTVTIVPSLRLIWYNPVLLRATYERIPQTFVDFGRIWRSQIDDRLAKEFRTGIASQRASLVIDRHIPTFVIRDKDRGGDALQMLCDAIEPCRGALKSRTKPLHVGIERIGDSLRRNTPD